jgi:hypothetical protein
MASGNSGKWLVTPRSARSYSSTRASTSAGGSPYQRTTTWAYPSSTPPVPRSGESPASSCSRSWKSSSSAGIGVTPSSSSGGSASGTGGTGTESGIGCSSTIAGIPALVSTGAPGAACSAQPVMSRSAQVRTGSNARVSVTGRSPGRSGPSEGVEAEPRRWGPQDDSVSSGRRCHGVRTRRMGSPSLCASISTPRAASVSGRVPETDRERSSRPCRTSETSSTTCAGSEP